MRLLLICVLVAISQSQQQPAPHKKNAQEEIQKPAANQPVSNNLPKQKWAAESQMTPDTNKEQDRAQTVKEINDTLLVIFTGVVAIFAWLQWRVLCEHEEWMQKHDAKLEQLAKAAGDNATAAKSAATTAQEHVSLIVNKERARVLFQPPTTVLPDLISLWRKTCLITVFLLCCAITAVRMPSM
jgi:hypothetical protein